MNSNETREAMTKAFSAFLDLCDPLFHSDPLLRSKIVTSVLKVQDCSHQHGLTYARELWTNELPQEVRS